MANNVFEKGQKTPKLKQVPDNYTVYSSAFEEESLSYLSKIKNLFIPASETDIYYKENDGDSHNW